VRNATKSLVRKMWANQMGRVAFLLIAGSILGFLAANVLQAVRTSSMSRASRSAKIQNLPNETAPVKPQTHQADTQGRATLSQQKTCSEQSEHFFNNWKGSGNTLETYTDHLDSATGICYMEISYTNSVMSGFFIMDVFENRIYGSFSFINATRQSSGFIEPPGQPKIECKSLEEFDELALKYFGTTQ